MLTEDQVVDLLSVAAHYDNRLPNPDAVLAWGEAARRGRWTFEAAVSAVHEHYANSTEFVMPGHITALLRAARAQPARFGEPRFGDELGALARPALPAAAGDTPSGPPARRDKINAVIAGLAAKLGWRQEHEQEHEREQEQRAILRDCPHCGVTAGKRCRRPSHKSNTGWTEMAGFHPSRTLDAQTPVPGPEIAGEASA